MITRVKNHIFSIDTGPNLFMGMDTDEGVILFDSCIDESVARKIDKNLSKNISAIVNSHSHADHIGGNHYFQKKYNCSIYVHPSELSFLHRPDLEPSLLNGGFSAQLNSSKFICAKPSYATALNEEFLLKHNITSVELFGHSPGLTGFIADGVFYIGDGIFSEEVILKHKVLYLYDAEGYNDSLAKIANADFDKAIFCHKGMLDKEDITSLIKINQNHILEIKEILLNIIDATKEDIIMEAFINKLDLHVGAELYLLIFSTIKGYLSMMKKEGLIDVEFDKGFIWRKL
jgi:glyoxylase-like metal-dependent hydrolase (beta-lactamase superfamily II)